MLLRRICALLANRRWMARDFRWFAGCRPTGMRASTSFRELNVWQQAMDLVEEVYAISNRFPSDERFGLTAQLRRAAVSIPSNIGEGRRRKRDKAFLHHLDIATTAHRPPPTDHRLPDPRPPPTDTDYRTTTIPTAGAAASKIASHL